MYNKTLIFDLDDTLYKEITYLKSAFVEISQYLSNEIKVDSNLIYDDMLHLYSQKCEVFSKIIHKYDATQSSEKLLSIYRNHKPKIKLPTAQKYVLDKLKSIDIPLGLLTDGRSAQQRNKIRALGLERYFKKIVISEEFGSEKPSKENYKVFQEFFGEGKYVYIGDNTTKDFVTPNNLKWDSICLLDDGFNIHKQDFTLLENYLPKYKISNFNDLLNLI